MCPEVESIFYCEFAKPDGVYSYDYKWSVSNGKITKDNGSIVYVSWNNVEDYGIISVQVSESTNRIKFKNEGKDEQGFTILCLKNKTPSLYLSKTTVPFNDQGQITASIDQMFYPKTNNEIEVTEYEWTLPEGWKTVQGKSGTFRMSSPIYIIPHVFKSGSIRVRGVSKCDNFFSNYATYSYSRSFSYTAYPQKIAFGDTSPYTFSVPSITNVQYEWKAPAGWSINGGGNTLTTSSSEVQIRALSYTTEKVQVRLRLNQDVSDWYTCPGGAIALPEVTTNVSGTIYQYEPLNFTINGLSGNNATINWRSDGYVISGQNSIQAKVAPTTVGTMNVYADISIPGYGSYTAGKQVSIANHRISLNKTVNSFGEGSCSLVNRPEGANVRWEFLDDGYKILSSDNVKATVVPLLYNATSTLRATVYSDWMSLPLTIDFISAPLELTGTDFVIYKPRRCEINYLPYNASLDWYFTGVYSVEQKDRYVYIMVPKELAAPYETSFVKAEVTLGNGTTVENQLSMHSIELKDFTLELVENNSRSFLYKASYTPANIPYKELLIYWNTSNPEVSIATTACKGDVPDDVWATYNSYRRKNKYPGGGGVIVEGGFGYSLNAITALESNDDSGLPFHYETNYAIFSFPGINPASAAIWCTVLDQAGNIITKRAAISTSRNLSPYQVVSNPVNNTLTLKKNEVEEVQTFENKISGVVTVQLYNDYNIVKTLQVYEGEDVLQMNTSDLPNGTYYLNITKDGVVITRQLILIKH